MDSVRREELINNLVHDAMEVARDVGDGSKSVGDGMRAHRETVAAIMSAFKRAPGVVNADEIARAIHEARCVGASCTVDFDMLDGCEDAQYLDALRRDAEAVANLITSAVEPSCVVSAGLGDAIYQAIRTRVGDHTASQIADTVVEEVRRAAQPSCVVTDEMVEAACRAAQKWAHSNMGQLLYDDLRDHTQERLKSLHKAALTAALSSRTEEEVRADEARKWKLLITGGEDHPGQTDTLTLEEAEQILKAERAEAIELRERLHTKHSEIRADERERLAGRIREQGRAINDDWGWCSAIADAIDCDFSVLNKPPARSLTNGGE